ncbi:MAG: sigma-70 family RNA polymerase sigma factor [Chromatiales bacterium]|nr:sigma-70 family RNA polymerase sigma factor [Chromatiales bacterium]
MFGSSLAKRQLKRRMEEYRPRLYRLAWSWCRDAQLADDLVQDCMVRGLQRIDQLRNVDQLEVWLTRILANLHKDHLRRRKETVDVDDVELTGDMGPEQDAQRRDLVTRVRDAVDRLNDDQRKVLTLVDLMEFSYADVAQALDIPVGTVMSRLCRARARLKQMLKDEDLKSAVVPLWRIK